LYGDFPNTIENLHSQKQHHVALKSSQLSYIDARKKEKAEGKEIRDRIHPGSSEESFSVLISN
jgi:hypothetical protein